MAKEQCDYRMRFSGMRQVDLRINKIAFGGAGFGHVDGKACFVLYTMPGDTARTVVKREKKSYIEAELIEISDPSPDRIIPECQVFGECGGCSLQHMPYPMQVSVKEELFAEQLSRFAGVDRSRILPMLPAENPFGYRSRAQIKIRWISNRAVTGFFRSGSHFIVPFPDGCSIVSNLINKVISEIDSLISHTPEPDRIPQVDVSTGDDGQAILIIHYIGNRPDELCSFLSMHHDRLLPSANGLWLQYGRKNSLKLISGTGRLSYRISVEMPDGHVELRLFFSRGGFSQVNYRQNRNLVRVVLEMAGLTGNERILDIYCGNGNFSLPLAARAREVVGIEEYEPSIEDARSNAVSNRVSNAVFFCSDAAAGVERLAEKGERFDVAVLDPPRSGAAQVMNLLPALNPKKVVYISCDPATLARDIAILNKLDYSVVQSIPIDMFPQTAHIESITLIERQ